MNNNVQLGGLIEAPLALLAVKDQSLIDQANMLIPYSTGFEIECVKGGDYNEDEFKRIPNIMDVSNDYNEQRYRIPNGITGIICLWHISIALKRNSELNMGSGIHYHVDCTDVDFKKILSTLHKNKEWVLKELDEWGYKGSYNSRGTSDSNHTWIRGNSSFNTLEFRLGEMTFDYDLLLKRIMHCNSIVKRLKEILDVPLPTFQKPDVHKILDYQSTLTMPKDAQRYMDKLSKLTNDLAKLEQLEQERKPVDPTQEIQQFVRKRIHKLK